MQSLRQFDKTIEEEKVIYFDFDDPDWYDWLYSEGFERMQRNEDSYTYQDYCDRNTYELNSTNYWYWARCFDYWLFRIYIFRDCIICEKEYECGGLAGSRYFDVKEYSMSDIWDQIIEYIKSNIA